MPLCQNKISWRKGCVLLALRRAADFGSPFWVLTAFSCGKVAAGWSVQLSDVGGKMRQDENEDDSVKDDKERPPAVEPGKLFMFMRRTHSEGSPVLFDPNFYFRFLILIEKP